MKMLLEDIKNGHFKNVYLLTGEEVYLRSQYRKKLREALLDPEDTMNGAVFEGKGISPGEVIDLAETMPFFAERRVIEILDSGFFKHASLTKQKWIKEENSIRQCKRSAEWWSLSVKMRRRWRGGCLES